MCCFVLTLKPLKLLCGTEVNQEILYHICKTENITVVIIHLTQMEHYVDRTSLIPT